MGNCTRMGTTEPASTIRTILFLQHAIETKCCISKCVVEYQSFEILVCNQYIATTLNSTIISIICMTYQLVNA